MVINIKNLVRDLRSKSTQSENKLWKMLRGRQFCKLKFVRQYPISVSINGRSRIFVADFYCHQLRLVIEVDGTIHDTQIEKDLSRTEVLGLKGITIIRIRNEDIKKNVKEVLIQLREQILPLLS